MRLITKLSFRSKLNVGFAAIVLLVAVPLGLIAGGIAAKALREESAKRGRILAANLAVQAADPLLARDLLRLKNMVDELRSAEDVAYAFVQDKDNRVLAHTFFQGFPTDLLLANPTPDTDKTRMRLLYDGEGFIEDYASPTLVAGDKLGTARVGISRGAMQRTVQRLTLLIAGVSAACLVTALLAGAWFSARVTRRINLLRKHAEEVAKGNLDIRTGPVLLEHCWDIMRCGQTDCPAYGDERRRCWRLSGTLCPQCPDPCALDKERLCKDCVVYSQNKGDEIQDVAETFDVMALSLRKRLEELTHAEQELTLRQRLLRTILDATPDHVSLMDERLVYLAVNKAFADFCGKTEEDILGKTDADIYAAPDAAAKQTENRSVLASEQPLHKEIKIRRADVDHWLHVVKTPVFDERGRGMVLLRTARDITRLRQYQEQLIQSQKMESLGKLAGGVAHEINTPLGVILGYSQLLQEDVPEGQIRDDLRIIEKQSKVCRKIVADLLGFSRQTESSKREMCFNNSVMEAISLVRHAFSLDRVEIFTVLDDRMPIIYGDPEKLKQVWINLLNNARDAIVGAQNGQSDAPSAPESGVQGSLGGMILLISKLDSPSQTVTLLVADNGPGIPAGHLARVFDPFFSTKPVGGGTGLGLSVSFGIIEEHGGDIHAQSPVPNELYKRFFQKADSPPAGGPGALMTVVLPLDNETNEPRAETLRA
jgi:PAS domain S-box-containing protein